MENYSDITNELTDYFSNNLLDKTNIDREETAQPVKTCHTTWISSCVAFRNLNGVTQGIEVVAVDIPQNQCECGWWDF